MALYNNNKAQSTNKTTRLINNLFKKYRKDDTENENEDENTKLDTLSIGLQLKEAVDSIFDPTTGMSEEEKKKFVQKLYRKLESGKKLSADLEREKKLYRNHGKAILIDPYIDNRNVSEKEKLYVEEKRLIGMKAASLITPKDSILIASGTTMHALARSIVPVDELTVITASMEVSNILASEKNIYIIQLGGILRHSSLSVVGKYAENILADFSCSKLFIGVDGIDLDFGITTTNMMEASLNRVMMQTAQKTIVLADSSKFGRRGFSKIADMEDVDHIITDSHIPPSTALRLEEMGIEVTIADSVHHNSI